MGEVFKAEHRLMERTVALKVIRSDLTANPTAVSRFRTEVRTAARLSHPNVVTVHDAEQVGQMHFLVMEFVEGVSLDRLVVERGPLAIDLAARIICEAALGLQHAHEHGMVHRDIKPQNLILTPEGKVKILDFGLARFAREHGLDADADQESVGITAANLALGTPDYIAPEQADNARNADIRADIYSLGCTFYFLLAGQPPFPVGSSLQKISSHMLLEPEALSASGRVIPATIVQIVERMMAKVPEDRFQTPSEVAAVLEQSRPPSQSAVADVDHAGFSGLARRLRARSTIQKTVVTLFVLVVAGLAVFVSHSMLNQAEKDGETRGSSAATDDVGQFPRIDGYQILFILPVRTYYPDFIPVREILAKQGGEIFIAALGPDVSSIEPHGGQPLQADLLLNEVDPAAFDAVVFVGGEMHELTDEGAGNRDINRILEPMNKQGRLIAGICLGVIPISDAGFFKGQNVTYRVEFEHQFKSGYATPVNEPVVTSRNLITAVDPDYARQFAERIVLELAKDP